MAKRKPIASVNDLFGKPKATPTAAPAPSPAPTETEATRQRTTKAKPAAPSTDKTRPIKARTDKQLQAEYAAYGKPWAVRLPPAVVAELKDIARRENVDLQALTRYVLEQFVSDYRAGQRDLSLAKKPVRYAL